MDKFYGIEWVYDHLGNKKRKRIHETSNGYYVKSGGKKVEVLYKTYRTPSNDWASYFLLKAKR